MPAEVPTTEKSLPSSADKMPTTTQKSNGDLGQTTPVFSYAQAAKGRAPSVSLSLPNGKALSDTPEAGPKRPSMSESRDSTSNPSNSSTKRTASEGREPQGKDFTGDEERPPARLGGIKYTPKSDNDSDTPVVAGLSHRAGSTPSSPEYGATSTSTLPKEDDTCSTANGSSESTWEKQSQMSQNGNKSGDKVDVEKDRQAPTSWDEESSAISASLKEAPPPPVNFWQQRREAQEAEARARLKRSASAQPTRTANLNRGPGHDGGPAKGADTNTEPKKQDNRKKGKNGAGPTEDRPGLGAAKDGMRSVDTADKSTNVAFAGPPPPGDAISWPTPDSAIGEGKEKEKVHERAEKVSDKDTTAAPQTHGKKWLPMAYVPSAVFVTPMHQVRRGGRLLRGTGGRGGSSSNASISAEKPAAGGVNISNGQAPLAAGTERGRGPINSSTTNATVSKGKRASSAGPITPREQWRSGEPTAPEKRNKETDIGSSKSGQSNGTNVNELRGSIVATSNKDPKDKLPSWAASQVSVSDVARNSDNSMHSNTNEDKNTRGKHLENQMSPRGGPERRSEGSIRAPDFAKDFQGGLPMRERGDGRQDRGRGGFRGRGGGNHAYLNSNVPNGHGFPNGHQPQYQSPPGPPAKSHSNHDRSPSQNQGSFYPPTQDPNRHHRNNSRSQSIPYSTQYGRFSNGHQSGAPHLANLQTDLANTYGFQPGQQGIMSAIPYNPFMEEVSLYGMMSMQM